MPDGVNHDGAQLPWLGDVLVADGWANMAHGYPVDPYPALAGRQSDVVPGYWPLNGRMSD